MADSASSQNPFGNSITPDDILDTLGFFDNWEDRYKYIIELGRELPPMAPALQTEERLVRGCQSQVWIDTALENGRLRVGGARFLMRNMPGRNGIVHIVMPLLPVSELPAVPPSFLAPGALPRGFVADPLALPAVSHTNLTRTPNGRE